MDKRTEDWLSPMNKIIWLGAFRERKTEVTLRDGREFKVRYSMENFYHSEAMETAYVEPVRGLVPRGYFPMAKVTNESWLTETGRGDRARDNIYLQFLDEFIKSEHRGVQVVETWPALEGRLASTIRQGMNHAIAERGKRAKNIKVMTSAGKVYLLKDDDGNV